MIINNWNTYLKSELAAPGGIHKIISRRVERGDLVLPDFRTSKDVIVFSDYGGEHKGVNYNSYSFLLTTPTDLQFLTPYFPTLRRKYSTVGRVMNYKNLNDKLRFKALPEYLYHYNYLNGILLSVLVDKRSLKSIFMQSGFDLNAQEFKEFSEYDKKVFEKTIRVTHFLSVLINGVCAHNQNVYWVTDEDDIVANDTMHTKIGQLFDGIIKLYVDFPLGELGHSHLKMNDDPNRIIEEFCGIPDLIAGALPKLQNHLTVYEPDFEKKQFIQLEGEVSPKDIILGNWLSESNNNFHLKRLSFMISGYGNQMRISSIKFKHIVG